MVEWLKNHSKACGPTEIQNTTNLNNQLAKTLSHTQCSRTYVRYTEYTCHNVANRAYLSGDSMHNVKLFSLLPRFYFSN